jgi:hypothetical protein
MATSLPHQYHEGSMRIWIPVFIVLLGILLVLPSGAHAPGIATGDVTVVPDAEKSYAWYGFLEDKDDIDQYLITAEAGTEIRLSTSSPDQGNAPPFAVIGPGIITQDPLPPAISLPEGYGSIVIPVPDSSDPPSYEPFTPMAMYEGASYSFPAPAAGEYTVAVFGKEGRYILATGFLEEFSLTEWVLIPVSVLSIRIWQGQSLFANLLPLLGAVLIGAWWFRKQISSPFWPGVWLLAIAGFAYIGSGILVVGQMFIAGLLTGPVPSMMLTALFAAIPILLGLVLVRIAVRTGPSPSHRDRGIMAVLGILGLIFWAGLIFGPVLAVAASLLPGSGNSEPP